MNSGEAICEERRETNTAVVALVNKNARIIWVLLAMDYYLQRIENRKKQHNISNWTNALTISAIIMIQTGCLWGDKCFLLSYYNILNNLVIQQIKDNFYIYQFI